MAPLKRTFSPGLMTGWGGMTGSTGRGAGLAVRMVSRTWLCRPGALIASASSERVIWALSCSAVKGFFDPSVQFGLQFDPTTAPGAAMVEASADAEVEAAAASEPPEAGEEKPGEKVVSLDAFRKKP